MLIKIEIEEVPSVNNTSVSIVVSGHNDNITSENIYICSFISGVFCFLDSFSFFYSSKILKSSIGDNRIEISLEITDPVCVAILQSLRSLVKKLQDNHVDNVICIDKLNEWN